MKLIIFITFIIFALNLTFAQNRPRCITTNNIYANSKHTKPAGGEVNWWYLNQLIDKDAIYTDSYLQSSESILEVKEFYIRDKAEVESPLYNTFIQSQDALLNYHSITYSDAQAEDVKPPLLDKTSSLSGAASAHSKGFFIWNALGGIHVIHSFPKSPTVNASRFVPKGSSGDFAQHAMCIELSPNELNIIPKYLIYSNSDLQTINNVRLQCLNNVEIKSCFVSLSLVEGTISNNIINQRNGWDFNQGFDQTQEAKLKAIKTFQEMEAFMGETILKSNPDWKDSDIQIGRWKLIAGKIAGSKITSDATLDNVHYFKAMDHSSNGKYFIQTSNGFLRANYQAKASKKHLENMKYEIIWKYIKNHPDYSEVKNWISHTMTSIINGPSDNSLIKTDDAIDLVYAFQSERRRGITIREIPTTKDHSKLLYGSSVDNKFNVFCVGDLNWQGVQILRGGGAFCKTDLGYLVDYYTRRVSWFRSRDTEFIPNRNGILNSLFTARSTYQLDWIGNGLKTVYSLDGSNLNDIVITPNSNEKVSFKLNHDYSSKLKLKVTKPTSYQETTHPSFVSSEPFSLEIYPSIPDKVFICSSDLATCDFESSIKISILKDLILPISYTIPVEPGSFSSKNFEVVIEVKEPTTLNWESKEELADLLNCVDIARDYFLKKKLQTPIHLIRNTNKDDFKKSFQFPLLSSPIDKCNVGIDSILFNEECQDLLLLCLYLDDFLLKDLLGKTEGQVMNLINNEFQIKLNRKSCLADLISTSGDVAGTTNDINTAKAIKRSKSFTPNTI